MRSRPTLRLLSLALLLLRLAVPATTAAHALPRSTPEAQGVSSAGILAFVEAADRTIDSLHSVMVLRHGQVVAEGWWTPYDAATRHELYSLSKSFTSTAVGLAVAEGRLSIDDPVLKFFPEDAPGSPSANLRSMRVRDLLRMATGHQDEPPTAADKISARSFLAQPVPHKPGSHFKYNTAATFMQSAIVQKVTGQTVRDYLQPRLFAPLGIEDPVWNPSFQGISLGGYGLNVRTEDIARFGQLYLQKGRWEGRQLVPAAWVEQATALQVANGSNPRSDWDQGYGYQFWRSRNGAYRGDGAFGQYCIVMPAQDAVVAITSGVKDMQAVLDLVWDKLLPAMQAKKLPADRAAQQKLVSALGHLVLPTAKGAATSPTAAKVAGKRFVFPANDQKLRSLMFDDAGALVMRFDGADQRLAFSHGGWTKGRAAFGTFPVGSLAVSGAWPAEDVFTAKVCFNETPFVMTLTMRFNGDAVEFDQETHVGFGSTRRPQLVGRAE